MMFSLVFYFVLTFSAFFVLLLIVSNRFLFATLRINTKWNKIEKKMPRKRTRLVKISNEVKVK